MAAEDPSRMDPESNVQVMLTDPYIQAGSQMEMLSQFKNACQFHMHFEAEVVVFPVREHHTGPQVDVQGMNGVKVQKAAEGMVRVFPQDQFIACS